MLQTAAIFQDKMILQRNKPITVWGTNTPGTEVTAKIQDIRSTAITNSDGTWQIELSALNASEQETLIVQSDEETITYTDVAIGEVWVAGGQSNMEFWIRYEKHRKEAFQDCPDKRLRFYDVPKVAYDGQLEEFDYSRQAVWREAVTPEELEYFSAVGYYFQKEIKKSLDVPVGIIGCSWGGTRSCAWMNPETVCEVGKPWMDDFEQETSKMDMDEYWKKQHNNPTNNKGNPFADPFAEFALPRTPSQKELEAFFSDFPDSLDDFSTTLQPKQIPGSLYEHMVKTIAPYGIRGFLWYQGESDDEAPGKNILYKDMLTGLISDWRKLWGDKELPFLIVQLPGYETWLMNTQKNQYPIIRKCQEQVTKTVDGTYLCSISDAGEKDDIHPKDKKVVGERLALLARGHIYGENILCDAPQAKGIKREGTCFVIEFDNASDGLTIHGERLSALKIFADDREVRFDAHTVKNQLVIQLLDCESTNIRVEYAQTSWYLVNLYNKAGIPAIPFCF